MSPDRKVISAMLSYLGDFCDVLRMERNDKILLLIKRMVATEVHSSIKVVPSNFNTFKDVSTKKQIPNKLAEEFKMCDALLLLSAMKLYFKVK